MRDRMTPALPSATDVLIVGAGIAGAGLAAMLAHHRRVTIIEAEDAPGRHATGRSAAFWHDTYGGAQLHPLSLASFDHPARPAAHHAVRSLLPPPVALPLRRT